MKVRRKRPYGTEESHLNRIVVKCSKFFYSTIYAYFLFLRVFFCFFTSTWTDDKSKTKVKKDAGKGKPKKNKKRSEKEALEDSDDGDYEGLEVDYMSDESRSELLSCGT